MRVAFGETRIFGRIEPRVHAGENGETPRWRKSKLPPVPELRHVFCVGGHDLCDNCHVFLPLLGSNGSIRTDNLKSWRCQREAPGRRPTTRRRPKPRPPAIAFMSQNLASESLRFARHSD